MKSFTLPITIVIAFILTPAVIRAEQSTDEPEHGVWLGVQLAPVPEPLADHLQLADTGLMVRNVFKDSPAEGAGIDRYDVIIKVDGENVADDVNAFIQYVGDKEPGDSLELDLYHNGQQIHLKVTLTKRPRDWCELEHKYPDEQEQHPWHDLRGRILRRGPHGWTFEDLGPMPEWRDLPHKFHDRLNNWFSNLDQIDEGRRVDKQGKVLHVQQKEDGTIVVKRYLQKDGESKAETKTFDNLESLKIDDPEAYELLESARKERSILRAPKDWTKSPLFRRFRDRGDDTYDVWRKQREKYNEALEDWHKQYDKYKEDLKEWQKQNNKYKDALEDWRKRMKESLPTEKWEQWQEWCDRFFQGPMRELEPPTFDMGEHNALPSTRPSSEPQIRFEQQSDGKITVHLQRGDAALSRTFESADDLKKDAPELYEQYQSLQEQIR